MSLYKDLFNQFENLIDFYRFEGYISTSHFNQHTCQIDPHNLEQYIYFSSNFKHHKYYVYKRIYQFIQNTILENSKIVLNYRNIINSDIFKQIVQLVEDFPLKEEIISVECKTSPAMNNLLYKNSIVQSRKKQADKRIEKCDTTIYGGGYGFYGEWIRIFNMLTYFYAYQKISRDDILEYLHIKREKLIKISTSSFDDFLSSKKRIIKINPSLFSDYRKYDLMDSLEKVLENKQFCKESSLSTNGQGIIKNIIQQYNQEREQVLKQTNKIYQKHII